ncbi:Beta-carotene isomerase d27, chloroplastic [Trifolium repens]|nr:Beta-carotene isomerase d27, chloroplastic [Trifolium repens]
MDAKMIAHNMSLTPTLSQWRSLRLKPKHTFVVGVLASPSDNIAEETLKKTNVYNDNWFDKLAINHLSKSVQAATGISNNKSGFDSLVEAATVASQKFNTIQQQEVILDALDRAFPKPILSVIRRVMPPSKLAREYFAVFTTLFCSWLLGPSEVRESEINGKRERNVVHIKKCRVLEQTNCVGICINLCKMPSQTFIKDSFGMPLNMVPNFDDMSCEMIFGQEPPSSTDDPALKQPCYKLCKAKKNHATKCLT